ncbi:hypothetical protein AAV35_012860 [Salimicrobium jeotgali]|uniref:Uncharacterized protein n=1 Tax=Salimicrobium jeotgali TaxID=1230341 RepID=K2GIZ7_9BACI|nr:hypothetical protein [Salimicrobium jeotgali]AKG05551.1 hypothetical protein AAV35_012860 [Salimicrobium jeotgali]EKE30454.1 hypothetical protein MJ3_13474 [Salimicrobium jeotgali]MBM7696597.1 hypothetical protein [Salimicrobium jeotgali]
MNIDKQFLREDVTEATKEFRCAWDLLNKMGEEIMQNNYEGAVSAAEGFIRSSRELEVMKERKKRHNHYENLLSQLHVEGVSAELVIRRGRDYYGES